MEEFIAAIVTNTSDRFVVIMRVHAKDIYEATDFVQRMHEGNTKFASVVAHKDLRLFSATEDKPFPPMLYP